MTEMQNYRPVVIMCTRKGTGGAQMNATRVATALKEQGLPVELCFFYAADDTPMSAWAKLYLPHPPKGLGDTLTMLRAMVKDLRRWRPQSIIGFHPLDNIVAGLSGILCGCRVRVASHRNPPDSQRPLFRLIDKALGTLPFYTKIICVSGDVASRFTQKYLDIEKQQKVLTAKPTTKKQWWKFWN